MPLKKSQLYSYLWKSCDELRGGMDASQYKDYILTLLFVKYVSDKYAGKPFAPILVPEGGAFADMVRLKGDPEIGDKINKIIGRLAEANDLKGVIDVADFNDEAKLGRGREMVDRLSRLIGIFEGIDLRANRAEGDDLLGDAYEYLMRNFATESGKSKGQFYTPAEVSRVMAQIVGAGQAVSQEQTVYDPTCGSGSLLIKVADEAPHGLTIYGQEMDNATAGLARMNMILHGHEDAEIWQGNTLADPHWRTPTGGLKLHDFVVANPPFSQKNWTSGVNTADDPFRRFEYGIPPARNGDYAFLLHILKSMKSTGKAAVILPHGVLFRGNAEANIRRELVRRGFIAGVIGLPANLFYGTSIPACILVLDKEEAHRRTGVFMMDASAGFRKDGAKNRLRERDIHRIVNTFNARREIPGYSRLVPLAEIEANDYNLNIPRYIAAADAEDRHDLAAHLHGGIPAADVDALASYWEALPGLREALFAPLRPGYLQVRVGPQEVRRTVLAHPAFADFQARALARFTAWAAEARPQLACLGATDGPSPAPRPKPKTLIRALSEALLRAYADTPLLDPYDLFQHLMDYWDATLQDDVYLVVESGWQAAARPRLLVKDPRENKFLESADLVVGKARYKMDLLPPALIAQRYFPKEAARVADLQGRAEAAAAAWEAFAEEHSGEEDMLDAARSESGALTQASLKERLRDLAVESWGADGEAAEERALIEEALRLLEAKAEAERCYKEAQAVLDVAILAQYDRLSVEEISALAVDDKWLATLHGLVRDEIGRVAQRLAGRVQQLEERYADPLPALEAEVATLRARVLEHLARMGVTVEEALP